MLSEDFFSSVCGPPVAANTAISKDVGIYSQSLTPSYAVKTSFKKSSCPRHGLAVSDTHVFAAQDGKAHVQVYSRARGNQEALVSFAERVKSLALAGNVLVVGTTEGRLILWETCTGRQVSTPPCHVQPVSCIAVTPHHILSGSDDSNINVWSRAKLLELDAPAELEPELVLSNHRGGVTDLVATPGSNPETSICVSASKDKTCIVWNYRTGHVLRTFLFPAAVACLSLDPFARALYVAVESRALYLVEMFGDKALLGGSAPEPPSIVVQVQEPHAVSEDGTSATLCMARSYDGSSVLTGHACGRILRWNAAPNAPPVQLANLNSAVTNLTFVPLLSTDKQLRPHAVIKPNQAMKQHIFTTQLHPNQAPRLSRFDKMLNAQGFPQQTLEEALISFQHAQSAGLADDEKPMQVPTDLVAAMKASTFRQHVNT